MRIWPFSSTVTQLPWSLEDAFKCELWFVFITVKIIISMEQQKIHINVFEEFGLIFPGIFKNLPQNIVKWCFGYSLYSQVLYLPNYRSHMYSHSKQEKPELCQTSLQSPAVLVCCITSNPLLPFFSKRWFGDLFSSDWNHHYLLYPFDTEDFPKNLKQADPSWCQWTFGIRSTFQCALSNTASLLVMLLLQARGCWSYWELLMAQQVRSACMYLQCFVMVVVNPPALKSWENVHWQTANTNSKCQWEDGVLAQSS